LEVIKDIRRFKIKNSVVTIGKFDGVHRGHRLLISKVQDEKDMNRVVFTFEPTEDSPLKATGNLYDQAGKVKLLSEYDLDYVILYPFGKHEASMTPKRFVKYILHKKLGMKKLIVGSDFRFGKKGKGDVRLLKRLAEHYKFELVVVDKLQYEGQDISSTRIRNDIKSGNIAEAEEMLGRHFE